MAPIAKTILLAAGGTCLFVGSFVGVALMSGRKASDIPLLKNFAHAPEHTKTPHSETPEDPAHANGEHPAGGTEDPTAQTGEHGTESGHRTDPDHGVGAEDHTPSGTTRATALAAFMLPSPFSSDELDDIQARIAEHLEEIEVTKRDIRIKADELDAREHALVDRENEIQRLKDELDRRTKDLENREQELARDTQSAKEAEEKSWTEVAKFFQEGKEKDLAKKLAEYSPEDAAKILRQLVDERAVALMNALPADKYKTFMDAYRKGIK